MRIFLTAVALVVALLAGCGESGSETADRPARTGKLREVRVNLNRYLGPEHAGLLMAEANGYFADVGLEVAFNSPGGPRSPIGYLLSKLVDSDFSVSHEPQVATAVANGLPIVTVGSLVSEPTAALIWLKGSGIRSIADLKGKTIAVPGLSFQVGFLERLLADSGLSREDVRVKIAGYDAVSLLTRGKADAIFGGSPQLEGVELRSLGRDPVVTQVHAPAFPPWDELVLIAPVDLASREPQLVRDFLVALSRGTAAAIRNPQAVVREIEDSSEPSFVSSRKAREAQVAAILPLLSKGGYMDPARAEDLIDWMYEEGMIQKKIPVSRLLTNEYLSQPEG